MTELERVLQRLARLLRGEEQTPPTANADPHTITAPGAPVVDRPSDTGPESEPGPAPA